MNNTKSDKDKAMRIVEALSGADAELVERCGRGTASGPAAMSVFKKYLAACAVFVVVCVGTFAVYLTTWRSGFSSSESAQDSAGALEYALTNDEENGSENPLESAGGDGNAKLAETEGTDKAESKSIKDSIAVAEQSTLKDLQSEMPLADAEKIENVGEHIPGIVPERFVMESCQDSGENEGWHNLTLRWADSDTGTVEVFVTDYYLVLDGVYNLPDYTDYGAITEENVDERCAVNGGRTSFCINIKFEDGVWSTVTVDADMTSEEIYKMLVSMGTVVIN